MVIELLAALTTLVPMPKEVVVTDGSSTRGTSEIAAAVRGYVRDPSIPEEGYRLVVDGNGVSVRASTSAGAFYAGETLRQLADERGRLPYVRIADEPAFSWRGLHLDVARHFFGKAEVLRFLETMASFKLNVLHWHLTDDQGWRIPIPGYPALTAAVRPVENRKNFRDLSRSGVYGPFAYTREDLVEIVRRATELHIRIVPEIEIPGHSRLLLKACPEFRCNVGERKSDNATCVGKEATIRFFERVLDEVCLIFPGDVIHIGGDECNRSDWKRCADCQARMAKERIKDVAGLQSWTTAHFERYLASKGRRLMGWDEIAEGGLPLSSMVMSWRGTSTGVLAARNGHDVVMCPNEFCYFDYEQCVEDDPVPYAIAWTVPVPWAKTYAFDPLKGLPAECRRYVLGAQGNSWTEKTCTEADLQWKVWPRAAALAEVLWSYPSVRNLREFAGRLRVRREALVSAGVNAAPVDLHARARPRGELIRRAVDGAWRIEYACGKTKAELGIADGDLVLTVNGARTREFKRDGGFCELEALQLDDCIHMVTCRRRGSELVVVVLFDGEKVVARDRWDGDE